MRLLASLFLILTIFGSPLWAVENAGECEARITGVQTQVAAPTSGQLTVAQAEEILGNYNPNVENGGGPGGLLRNAVAYLLSHEQSSVAEAVYNLEIFLKVTRLLSIAYQPGWGARRIMSIDGAAVFAGGEGHAIVISPNGEIYRGQILAIESRYSKPFVWDSDYSKLKRLGQIKIAPDAAASP